jgi:hypothetical protein
MRFRLLLVPVWILTISLLIWVGASDAADVNSPEPEIVSGEVISLCNYLAKGHRGEENAEEGRFLVEKKGLPVAILAEDGEIYIAILKGFNRANDKLAPLLGKKVNARGPVYRHPGANLIEVQIVSEALD